MPIFSRDTLHTERLPWMESDDFEFFVLGRQSATRTAPEASNGQAAYWGVAPDPFVKELQPTSPRERIVVLHGEVQVECEIGRFTLRRRDFLELPRGLVRLTNTGNATAELAHVKGHWSRVIRQEICLFRPDRPCDYHYHDGDEYWMVFRGHFTLNYDEREYAMRPGLMLAAGMGFEHGAVAPEEHFEAVVMATGLEGQRRDGHLTRELHGAPRKGREVPASAMRSHQLQPA